MNILSKIIMPFVLVMALLIMPTMVVTLNIDHLSQEVIDNAVQDFVDDARSSGRITSTDYEQMMATINSAQPLCDISITCGKESYVLEGSELVRYYDEYTEDAILDVIYTYSGDNEDYCMSKGDYLKVRVKNSTPPLGMKLLGLFLPRAKTVTSILTTYGGYVETNGVLSEPGF